MKKGYKMTMQDDEREGMRRAEHLEFELLQDSPGWEEVKVSVVCGLVVARQCPR